MVNTRKTAYLDAYGAGVYCPFLLVNMMRYLILVFIIVIVAAGPVQAQDEANAWTTSALIMHVGPGEDYDQVTSLLLGTGLMLEARTEDQAWVLGYTLDGFYRGWISSLYIVTAQGFSLNTLPISDEIVEAQAASIPYGRNLAYEAVDLANGQDFLITRANSTDLTVYPVVAEVTETARIIFQQGQALGHLSNAVAKVGDCNSAGWLFLHPFGENQYDLVEYGSLQGAVDYFAETFAARSYAAYTGMNVGGVLDPTWADPINCNPDEAPLFCEYRQRNPSLAVIMFGSNDIVVLTTEQFDHALRQVVNATRQAGIVPILSTFPRHISYPDRSIQFNQIVVQVARDYNLPLINLWRALEPLPNHGIAPDGYHLSGPLTRAGDMTPDNLQTGFPLRNLVTLQSLDAIWRGLE
jgi:uncharacterized protein YraI